MPNFVVDPLLTTVPQTTDRSELAQWLTSLESWVREASSSPFSWCHFLGCTQQLVLDGLFPDFAALRNIIQGLGVDVDAAGLTRAITRFFQDPNRDLRAITATKCAVVEDGVDVAPVEFFSRNDPRIHSSLMDSLLCLACDKSTREAFASDALIVTAPFQSKEEAICIRGSIALTDPDDIVNRVSQAGLDETFLAVFSPIDLITVISPDDIWQGGEEEFLKAVERRGARIGGSLLPVQLHGAFWESLRQSTIYTDLNALDKLCRICALVLAGQAKDVKVNLRSLRTSKAGNSPQRIRQRDGAAAWRLTISDRGIGWRLHYWHVPMQSPTQQEVIELVNVVRKHDAEVILE